MNYNWILVIPVILTFFPLSIHPNPKKRAVYDCFTFFNEIEILKIRLNELNDVVDYFVLVESKKTFSGNDKPSYYLMYKNEFQEFNHKIIHVLLNDAVSSTDYWANETYQRNNILTGLENADNDDIVICADLDEIPRHTVVKELKNYFEGKTYDRPHPFEVFYLWLDWYAFKLNAIVEEPWRNGTYITTCSMIRRCSPQNLRRWNCAKLGRIEEKTIKKAGWHLTWMGTSEDALYKLKSFSHAKDSFITDDETLKESVKTRMLYLLAGQPHMPTLINPNDTFPKYVIDNLQYFVDIGYIQLPE